MMQQSLRHEEVTSNGTLKKYFSLIKDMCIKTEVALLQAPVNRKVEMLVPSAMIDNHHKPIIGILFSQYYIHYHIIISWICKVHTCT